MGRNYLRIPRHMEADNIKMDLREIVYEGVYRIQMAQDRVQPNSRFL
jgi:hypothetical protein